MARIAGRLLRASAVQVNLITPDAQVPVAFVGDERWGRAVPHSHSFCIGVVESGEPVVVEDASSDPRVHDAPVTTEAGLRSYVGVPLRTSDGQVVGTLCVVGLEPRRWEREDVRILEELAAEVVDDALGDQRALRAAVETLREKEARFQHLIEHLPGVFWVFDEDFSRAIYISPSYERLFGRSLESIYEDPQSFVEAIHPDDRELMFAAMGRVRKEPVESFEYRVVLPDGSIRWLASRGAPVRDESGRVHQLVGITDDVTEEREREEERRLLAIALENLREGVSISRFDGQIIYANATHAKLLGYDRDRHPLPNTEDFTIDGGAEQLDRIIRTAAERGVWRGRIRRRRLDDGRVLPMEVVLGRVDRDTGPGLLFSIARDVTEDIERERHLRRAERLASVGTLLGGVAHELNNPLHAIQNFAELLVDDVDDSGVQEDLLTIQREAVRAARIVSDLRLLARGTQEERGSRAPVDLNDIVRHVLGTRRYSLETKNIEVCQELAADLPSVMGDCGQLEQILLNLVVNAEQAMAGNGPARRLVVRTTLAGDNVRLHVIDSGSGIPEDHLDRIFDPFWTTKAPGEGTGLGLSLVHSIVTEHGGEIHVESEPDQGASFRIELPCARAVSSPGNAKEGPAGPARTLRILVVDDEPVVRRVLERYLTRRGHRVDGAAEGAEALRLVHASAGEAAEYDVIVSDLRMPGLGGEELFERLRAEGNGMERRIIFMTGDAVGGDAARILDATGAPVLYKPVRLDTAVAQIERHAE